MTVYTTLEDIGDHMVIRTDDQLNDGTEVRVIHRGVTQQARVLSCAPVDGPGTVVTYSLVPA